MRATQPRLQLTRDLRDVVHVLVVRGIVASGLNMNRKFVSAIAVFSSIDPEKPIPLRTPGVYTAIFQCRTTPQMNSENPLSWRRHIVFDPMNTHSQADDPALAYVIQFNADERECQQSRLLKLTHGEEDRDGQAHAADQGE
jgi:hypothetical protein